RQAKQRDGAHRAHIGDASHLNFDRDGDVALDLFGRLPCTLRDHVYQRWYRIGVGLDVELDEAHNPSSENQQQQQHDQDALAQGEGDERIHIQSDRAARSMNKVPLVTTLSSACTPARTSTRPLALRPVRISREAMEPSAWETHTRALLPS